MWTALLLAADLAGTLAVSDRTELRVRAPGTAPAAAAFDAETTLTARLTMASKRWRAILAYTPRLTLWDAGAPVMQPTLLNGGEARVEWWSRRIHVSIDERASYGGMSFAGFALTPGPEGQPPKVDSIPTAHIIQFVSSTTTIGSHSALRRWTVDTALGYQLSGGATRDARALLPYQAGPFGEAIVDYAASRVDHAVTRVSASEALFSSGPESVLAEVGEGYRHFWSRLTETRLTVGVSEARVRTSAFVTPTWATYPVVEAAFERHAIGETRLDVVVNARLGPTVNRLIGFVDERVGGSLTATHTYGRLISHVFASASQSVPPGGVYGTTLLACELGVAYGATKVVAFDAGVRAFWQRMDVTKVPFVQGTVFAGLTLRAPTVKF